MDRDGRFTRVLAGEAVSPPPVWLMRQAGRYLPEYRALRTKAPDFLSFCLTPDLAVEATLQPIRRFGFDASIVFADILVVPHAFGQKVWFVEGEGPRLDAIVDPAGLARLAGSIDLGVLEPVCASLRALRAALPAQTGLIGFCGAPFTVATYMIAGKGTKDQEPARLFAYRHPEAFQVLIDRITEGSIAYLCAQIAAGAEAVQVFDSWASVLPPLEFARWCVAPMKRIVAGVKAAHPEARIIGFPRGSTFPAGDFSLQTGVDAISFDTGADLSSALAGLSANVASQGNLDPLALVAGGAALDGAVDHILEVTRGRPHVFNLGHGIVPQTPIAHVEQMLERVRG